MKPCFNGLVAAEWLEDGRDMRLLKDLIYCDRGGKIWTAPAGRIVNGASIPQFLWDKVGSPYCGRYRRASVIHDIYCEDQSEPWEAVHQVFEEMMEVDGVDYPLRREMFLAVWYFGPRW